MDGINSGIAWNDIYSLENEQIDRQHKKLFELLSGLVEACTNGTDTAKLHDTLMFLGNYTSQHFYFEEELQLQYNYPEYARHKKIHDDFIITVNELIDDFNKNGSSTKLNNTVNKVVIKWLINHIQGEDKKIGEYIRKTSANKF